MKKIILSIAVMVAVNSASFAQTNKNNWLAGGSAGFSSSKINDYTESVISISPDFGYFVIDDLALGAMVSFTSDKPKDGNAATNFMAAPFVRYYFVPLGANAKLFGQGSFGFGSTKSGEQGAEAADYTQWQLAAGPAVFLNPHTALEFTLSYGQLKYKDLDKIGTIAFNVGFQIHLGGKAGAKK